MAAVEAVSARPVVTDDAQPTLRIRIGSARIGTLVAIIRDVVIICVVIIRVVIIRVSIIRVVIIRVVAAKVEIESKT
jgi:hypothetical protein